MEALFHVFKVSNYRGGELSCAVNLSKYEAIDSIYEYWLEQVEEGKDLNTLTDDDILCAMQLGYTYKYSDVYSGPEVYMQTEKGLEMYEFTDSELLIYARKSIKEHLRIMRLS